MHAAILCFGLLSLVSPPAEGEPWQVLFEHGFKLRGVRSWTSNLTRAQLTAEGLRIVDPSTEPGSGRFFHFAWNAHPGQGATVEACLKAVSCSGPWGMCLLVSDGVHEEGITFFPKRVLLATSNLSAAFDCAGAFHTYTVRFRGTDISVEADGKRLIDGADKFRTAAVGGRNQVGFGAGASAQSGEAVWQRVRFRGPKVQVPLVKLPRVPGLEIELGATQVIVPNATYVSLFKLADGDMVVGGRRSSDGGKTWRSAPSFSVGAYQFPDGEIVELGFNTKRTGQEGVFQVPLARSHDNGRTIQSEAALLKIPEGTGGTGDDGKYYEGPCCDHAIVGLRDGSLLAGMYGYFKSDTVLVETFPKQWKLYKYRTWVMRSRDRGKTWDYLSTVAYDPAVGLESFCEPDLVVMPDGQILCFMRTGGSGGKHTPLYLSRSSDDGKTWSKPEPIADRGVWPNACLMRSGVLVCTYGRPGNWLAFSLDQGKTWTGHFRFYEGSTSSYNSVEEVAPGRLLVVYDREGLTADGQQAPEVVGTYFTVQRK